jgi:hypothetical protein
MQKFKDIHGRDWTVNVTVSTVKRVKAQLDIDMLNNIDEFIKLTKDIMSLCDILYVVCWDEAEQRGITDEQFAASLGGPVLREAESALSEAYIAFFPDPKVAANLRVANEKYNVLLEKALALVEKKTPEKIKQLDSDIETFLVEFEKDLDNDFATGNSSTN